MRLLYPLMMLVVLGVGHVAVYVSVEYRVYNYTNIVHSRWSVSVNSHRVTRRSRSHEVVSIQAVFNDIIRAYGIIIVHG